jgi:hypothetical protein
MCKDPGLLLGYAWNLFGEASSGAVLGEKGREKDQGSMSPWSLTKVLSS